ncbi:MAG: hypothetical protein VX054_04680 [Pseudomonadota bacterium]|nr:hypothetical protein [Pseudomonadota bacterium]
MTNVEVAVIFVGATPKQHQYWWPSFNQLNAGMPFDLIYVHRDYSGFAETIDCQDTNRIILENKVERTNGGYKQPLTGVKNGMRDLFYRSEIKNKAFGAYAHFFEKYKDKYKYFAFISDDVYLRRNNWLYDAIGMFSLNDRIGFVSPALHNNPRHIRAPIWFGSSECLSRIKWNFSSDHDGEMSIADRCVDAGYFGVQVGHKCDLAYDPDWDFRDGSPRLCGTPMPVKFFETHCFGAKHFDEFFSEDDLTFFLKYDKALAERDFSVHLTDDSLSSSRAYQEWNVVLELQPFHGLIYNGGLAIAKSAGVDMDLFEGPIPAGHLDVDNGVYFGANHRRYHCHGVTKDNPIAVLKTA